jgi:hypothetical protein
MLGQDVLETVARHRLSSGIEEQLRRITGGAHLQPGLHSCGRLELEQAVELAFKFARVRLDGGVGEIRPAATDLAVYASTDASVVQ